MRTITAKRKYSDSEAEAKFAGKNLTDADYDLLIQDDADVYDEDGRLLLCFRKNVVPASIALAAYKNLRKAATPNDNRGNASAWDEEAALSDAKKMGGIGIVRVSGNRFRIVKKDGSLSKQTRAVKIASGIVGFFDRSGRFPYCRQTAYTEQNLDKFVGSIPFVKCVDRLYAELVPDAYAKQRGIADATSQDFVIKGTAFTTVTVNKNYQTAVHKDAGDFKEGFGNLCVLQAGHYEGGYTCFPEYGVAVDVRTKDILLMDVHRWHGNTPLSGDNFERISLVMYYRENMHQCGSVQEELERIKKIRG